MLLGILVVGSRYLPILSLEEDIRDSSTDDDTAEDTPSP